ncbi:hypothetical protein L1887_07100 [Cichorium endivia]|nr:hypothetical protein L1887_07100 [Cichorium endivia]
MSRYPKKTQRRIKSTNTASVLKLPSSGRRVPPNKHRNSQEHNRTNNSFDSIKSYSAILVRFPTNSSLSCSKSKDQRQYRTLRCQFHICVTA